MYSTLMSKLDELNTLNEITSAVLGAVDTGAIGPLLLEMFDVR